MAITIDWTTRVISVEKSDMSLIQSDPFDVYELDIDAFRRELKSIEDSEAGIVNPDTHSHNTLVNIGGFTLARVVEIINGYTITFEDGQYAVNLNGANSNLGDVVNLNQVSIRSANTAGLIESQVSAVMDEIREMAFRSLGQQGENVAIDQQAYDGSGLLTSSRKRIYDNATDASNNADTGVIATYAQTATYNGTMMTSYTEVFVP